MIKKAPLLIVNFLVLYNYNQSLVNIVERISNNSHFSLTYIHGSLEWLKLI